MYDQLTTFSGALVDKAKHKVDNSFVGSVGQRRRTGEIRDHIVEMVARGAPRLTTATAERFGISRQAVSKHIRALVDDGILERRGGATRARAYALAKIDEHSWFFELPVEEDVVWRESIEPWLPKTMRQNVRDIAHYAITEMINNAVDHSGGTTLLIKARRTAAILEFMLSDNGVGIFQKIRAALNLADEREGVLELAKGKLTTDPQRHSGEGIFFTSRMCDGFTLMSGVTALLTSGGVDWAWETKDDGIPGTYVGLKINLLTDKTTNMIFDKFANVEGGFAKTCVPVALAKYGDENLVSRSQAKRLLGRFERFKEVMLDFHGVNQIGQAFADEVFRVFATSHPDVHLIPVRANPEVTKFIRRAELAAAERNAEPTAPATAATPPEPTAPAEGVQLELIGTK